MEKTLFAHLATRFVTQRENLATEALSFILQNSAACRAALADTFGRMGIDLPRDLAYHTQDGGEDQSIPDLVGLGPGGEPRVTVEAKFWAGLTGKQPVGYLRRIEQGGGGALAFLVPSQRAELLWHELLSRCTAAGMVVSVQESPPETRLASIPGNLQLGLLTWRAVLASLATAADMAGESMVESDIRQLAGLCEREDSEAFLPLTSEELTGTLGNRVIQLSELAEDLAGRLVDLGIADVRRLRAAGSKGWYGRYMKVYNVGCLLAFNARAWRRSGITPLWLTVWGPNWTIERRVNDPILREAQVAGVTAVDTPSGVDLPVTLSLGVEREQVMARAIQQLLVYAGWIRELRIESAEEGHTPSEMGTDDAPA